MIILIAVYSPPKTRISMVAGSCDLICISNRNVERLNIRICEFAFSSNVRLIRLLVSRFEITEDGKFEDPLVFGRLDNIFRAVKIIFKMDFTTISP